MGTANDEQWYPLRVSEHKPLTPEDLQYTL